MGGISLGPLQTPQLTPGHSAYLVIPSRDTVQAVILLQQVDGLAQETERGWAQGLEEGHGQTQSHSDVVRADDGTQESCLLPTSPKSSLSSFILCLLKPNTCRHTSAKSFPSLLSLLPPETSPRHFIAFFPEDLVKQRGPVQLFGAAWRGKSSPEKIHSNV